MRIISSRLLLFAAAPFLVAVMLLSAGGQLISASQKERDGNSIKPFHIENLSFLENGLSFTFAGDHVIVNDSGRLETLGLNANIQQTGAPNLPYYSTWLILPPRAEVGHRLSFGGDEIIQDVELRPSSEIEYEGQQLPGGITIPPVDRTTLVDRLEVVPNEEDAFYPDRILQLSEPMYVRDMRLVKLSIYPLHYNPVQKQLKILDRLDVELTFVGADYSIHREAPSFADKHQASVRESVLNWDQGKNWRELPELEQGSDIELPIGVDVYKIEVNENAIYKITYSDLLAAGMDVDNIDPNTIQMMYRGQPVSYYFSGNDDGLFQPGEYILFYGWEFEGPRLERQFFNNNVFWLWTGGTPSIIGDISSVSGLPVNSVTESITREINQIWYPVWTDEWDYFPNDPDAWYWYRFTKGTAAPITRTFEITLPKPAASTISATFTAEISSKPNPVVGGNPVPHKLSVLFNGGAASGNMEWFGTKNFNITSTISPTDIGDGLNHFDVVLATEAPVYKSVTAVYLNRITVDYQRLLTAMNDRFDFEDNGGAAREFHIGGFSNNAPSEILVWDISNPLAPQSFITTTLQISGTGPYTYSFGTANSGPSEFLATTRSNTTSPLEISRFVPQNLQPQGDGADWVAFASTEFLTETQRLAAHRAQTYNGALLPHVVNIEAVINQYGYGFPLPSAFQAYLVHALSDWARPPTFAVIVGDSTVNPQENLSIDGPFIAPQVAVTDLAFVDRFTGQIPSDLIFSLLSGDDLLPDISVGRIPVTSTQQLAAVVDKIELYEQNQLLPASWMENIIFLSDAPDPGAGDFCLENQLVGSHIPDAFSQIELCLPENPTAGDIAALRSQFFTETNIVGALLVNYRGHGAINTWGDNTILSTSHVDDWNNPTKPLAIVTGDCLDGFFALPSVEGLAETFLRAESRGSAAHWSSSGLGYSFEHSALVEGFYDGLFLAGHTAVGSAADYAKVNFFLNGGHKSLLYSFILEGDPAMQIMRPAFSLVKSASAAAASQGDLVDFTVEITNSGIFPGQATITDTLPDGMNYLTATASISTTIITVGNDLLFDLQFGADMLNKGLPRDTMASITITAQVDPDYFGGTLTNFATVKTSGMEAWPGDESDSASVVVYLHVFIPLLYVE